MWERGGVSHIRGRRECICSRCVLTHCQVFLIRYKRPCFLSPFLLCLRTFTCFLPPVLRFFPVTFLPALPSVFPSSLSELLPPCEPCFSACPEEKDDPDNGNEHIPAVGSNQLTLTSVPDQTTD